MQFTMSGFDYWMQNARHRPQEPLHSVQLDRNAIAATLVQARNVTHVPYQRGTASLREGRFYTSHESPVLLGTVRNANASGVVVRPMWATGIYEQAHHERWVRVPLWAAVGPPRFNAGRNRREFATAQPRIKTISLMNALGQSFKVVAKATREGRTVEGIR